MWCKWISYISSERPGSSFQGFSFFFSSSKTFLLLENDKYKELKIEIASGCELTSKEIEFDVKCDFVN